MAELRRLYAPPEAFRGAELLLDGERLRHARTVLRLRPGDELVATDGAGAEYRVAIAQLGRAAGRAVVLERTTPQRESPLRVVLAQAVPRGDRFAIVLEKAVELGVGGIVPVLSGRTVPTGAGGEHAEARWRRIMEGALAQSGRTRLPTLCAALSWQKLVDEPALPALRLLLWERAQGGLGAILARQAAPPPEVLVAVGPEGGWSSGEAELAVRRGFLPVRLGPRILRSETAGIAALAILQQRWGDLG
ncbi:MAG TPA: 16S rRNA (uracil(1498)-N(3))-methyltransferase [Candidatus Methanoperedens sp.]|nr:16S rRNA (uracil(1498)-N(3))-methyltransferase [Candidatus Methanoperedens sp.]